MDNTRAHLYLAALLHDIGKFYQRADNRWNDENQLSSYSRKLANDICPINDSGKFGYQHVVWTNEFLERMKLKLEKIPDFKLDVYDETNFNNIFNFAANHHTPKTELQALISLADWWSAGIDRHIPKDESKIKAGERIFTTRDRYKQIPLYSVFNTVNNGTGQSAFPLHPLDLTNCFPKEIKQVSDGESQTNYKKLWDKFIKEFEKLSTDSFIGFSESLLYLLKKYTWCIPSNTMDMANVSLYEHLKTTAAFADCLYLYYLEKQNDFSFDNVRKRISLKEHVCPVILLGGDLSGIQKFIYKIASRKAAVSLKGRSFYLQLLIDSAIQRIISHEDIDVNIGNVVYSSGGKFYMLLPNTNKVIAAIEELKIEFEQELWNDHAGQLLLNMDYVPFAYLNNSNDLYFDNHAGKTIGDLWKSLAEKLSALKNQKFKSVLLDENAFNRMFNPIKFDKGSEVCAVTGIEAKIGNAWNECVKIDSTSGSPYVLQSVKWQACLGKTLKDAAYLLSEIGDEKNTYLINNIRCNNISFGINTYLLNTFPTIASADFSRIKKINDTDFLKTIGGRKVSYGFEFYGGNRQALNNKDENKTFEELADDSYLGILRMDVDNLGQIFIKGLPDEAKSFAAYSTLSFLLDYFFSGYLNTIRNSDDFKHYVNILYAGGDDVFAIGRWDKLILFAHKIRKEFEKFVGRPDISVSGGIAIVGEKFPIAKAAEMAQKAEDAAKSFISNNSTYGTKNAFNLFGESFSWQDEYDYILKWQKEFVSLCSVKEKPMPHSILHKIMFFAEIMKKGDMKYVWHTVYFLKRFSENKSDTIKTFCEELKKEILGSNRNYELMAIAARWAELKLRLRNCSLA